MSHQKGTSLYISCFLMGVTFVFFRSLLVEALFHYIAVMFVVLLMTPSYCDSLFVLRSYTVPLLFSDNTFLSCRNRVHLKLLLRITRSFRGRFQTLKLHVKARSETLLMMFISYVCKQNWVSGIDFYMYLGCRVRVPSWQYDSRVPSAESWSVGM